MPARALLLRQSQLLARRTAVRHASSTSEAASKASQTASSAASKAQEGLSKVTAAAGPAVSNAASALRKVGGPVGKVVSFVDCKDIRFPNSHRWLCDLSVK
jgi:F-type H+-transporting ATPase subunit g